MSIRPVEMPMAEAMRRFWVTARILSPNEVARSTNCNATKTRIASAMIQSRPDVIERPPTSTAPDMKSGAVTCLLLAPKIERTACCNISETPHVASRVSSGRP